MKYARILIWIVVLILLAIVATTLIQQNKDYFTPTIKDTNPANESSAKHVFDISETDGILHTIPLSEILSGGPEKDGIPSIDNPKFNTKETSDLSNNSIGIGIEVNGDSRFYPYNILVWHEIVNDTIGSEPVAVTYCPLCGTGIAFSRTVDGEVYEFGVSGLLWQSNLLMYNRAEDESTETLWSQILGQGVVGPLSGVRLDKIPGDTTRLSDWLTKYPNSKILSSDTGEFRDYGRDPYGNYYTDDSVSFGASFTDERLHPKELIQGIEIDGKFKAYKDSDITQNEIIDTFAGKEITITRNNAGQIEITADGSRIEPIRSFWFSWVAVHPQSELYIQ